MLVVVSADMADHAVSILGDDASIVGKIVTGEGVTLR